MVVDAHRPLHAPALLLALTVLARRFPVLWPLVAGMLFHRFLDYAWSATHALRRPAPCAAEPAGKAGDPLSVLRRDGVPEDAEVVQHAPREHEEVPHGVGVGDVPQQEEHDPEGVAQPAGQEQHDPR